MPLSGLGILSKKKLRERAEMANNIVHTSLENAFYFSFATFVIIWTAGFLFELLEKTTGRLNMGVVILIVLGLVLIIFFLALTNILMSEEAAESSGFFMRLAAVFLFALVSTIILFILISLFWYPI
jgi:hypothetical protein